MNEPDHNAIADAPPDASADCNALIASLRSAGADRFDPVRMHYVEALSRRASAHQGSVRRVLDSRLAHALATLKERFDVAHRDASEAVARSVAHYPQAASDLQQLLATGDFKGVQRQVAALKARDQGASLGALVRQLEQQASGSAAARPEENAGLRPELKTIRNARNTWAKLSVDKQVAQAFEQAPTNAGPINSHMLVLRSLALMREISPDYLNRFMPYAEALLCLDQGEKDKPILPKKPPAAKAKTAKK